MSEAAANLAFSALVAGSIACLVTTLMVPLTLRLARALGAIDQPGGRHRQTQPTPRLGGIAILAGLTVGVSAVLVLRWSQQLAGLPPSQITAVLIGTAIIFLLGLADDLFGMTPLAKLLVQFAAAAVVVQAGLRFETFSLPGMGTLELGVLGGLASCIWIVGVTNAINLIDGLDGLASGVVAIIALSFSIYAFVQGNSMTVLLMAAAAGSCVGFLRQNWHPAKVFMGDSGALTLGFLLAAVSVHSSLKTPAAVAILVPLLALGVPIIDACLVMLGRFLRGPQSGPVKRVLRMFNADRNHLHHLMEVLHLTRPRVVLGIYALVVAFCAFSLTVALSKSASIGVALIVVEFVVILAVRHWGFQRVATVSEEESVVADNVYPISKAG